MSISSSSVDQISCNQILPKVFTAGGQIAPPPGLDMYSSKAIRDCFPASTSTQWREYPTPFDVVSVGTSKVSGGWPSNLLDSIALDLDKRLKESQPNRDELDSPKSCSTDAGSSSDDVGASFQDPSDPFDLWGPCVGQDGATPAQQKSALNLWTTPWSTTPMKNPSDDAVAEPEQSNSQTPCQWHTSATAVGVVSKDGHVFTKADSGKKVVMNEKGFAMNLSSICMVSDATLRRGGSHTYHYRIVDGVVGPADSAGFVFDSRVRRNNIQKMCSVFLNSHGRICYRDQGSIKKIGMALPPLVAGMSLTLHVDLDKLVLRFVICSSEGLVRDAVVSLGGILESKSAARMRSGFFCAVLTKTITVSLW